MAKHRHHYENLRALLLAGWVDDKGKRHAFRSLEDLERRDAARRAADMAKPEADRDKELAVDSPSFARIKQDLCVSMRTMWHNLHSLYPKLRKMQQRYKRIRKNKAAVVVRSSSSCTAQPHCSHACSQTQCMQLQLSRMSVPLRLVWITLACTCTKALQSKCAATCIHIVPVHAGCSFPDTGQAAYVIQ